MGNLSAEEEDDIEIDWVTLALTLPQLIYSTFGMLAVDFNWRYQKKKSLNAVMKGIETEGEGDFILNQIKKAIMPFVPVRSGKLLDTILYTMRLKVRKLSGQYVWEVSYNYPDSRKTRIKNPKHSSQKGYGELVYPYNKIPNRTLIRTTAGGNALYELNDPRAVSLWRSKIEKVMAKEMIRIENAINELEIEIHI